MLCVNNARLSSKIKVMLQEIVINFEGMLRTNANKDKWTHTDEFQAYICKLLNELVEHLYELTLERASQRSMGAENFNVIKQDVLDAFDLYKISSRK